MKYEVNPIRDAACTLLQPEAVATSDDLAELKEAIWDLPDMPYGYAIVNTETHQIDWGYGFDVPVPDPEDEKG